MNMLWITWAVCAVLIVAIYLWVGKATTKRSGGDGYSGSVLGLLVDDRGRYSLTRLQLSLWTLVVLSLTAGVFAARAGTRGVDPLGFSIPAQVLGLLGISVGSAAIATGVKSYKNRMRPTFIAASQPGEATFAQMLMVEEGPQADKTVDVYKMQNFLVTVFLVAAYVVLAVHTYAGWGTGRSIASPADIATLPAFSGTFLALLAISHAGYLGGKMPNRGQDPEQDVPDVSMATVNADRTVDREASLRQTPKKAAQTRLAVARKRILERSRTARSNAGGANGGVGTLQGGVTRVEQPTATTATSAAGEVDDATEDRQVGTGAAATAVPGPAGVPSPQ
jgi:hypothetical protein